jgi:hypothetical protein
MSDRPYTIDELDALRAAVWKKYHVGLTYYESDGVKGWVGRTRSCAVNGYHDPATVAREAAVDATDRSVVEDYVRTHMLAGHTADDLLASLTNPIGR